MSSSSSPSSSSPSSTSWRVFKLGTKQWVTYNAAVSHKIEPAYQQFKQQQQQHHGDTTTTIEVEFENFIIKFPQFTQVDKSNPQKHLHIARFVTTIDAEAGDGVAVHSLTDGEEQFLLCDEYECSEASCLISGIFEAQRETSNEQNDAVGDNQLQDKEEFAPSPAGAVAGGGAAADAPSDHDDNDSDNSGAVVDATNSLSSEQLAARLNVVKGIVSAVETPAQQLLSLWCVVGDREDAAGQEQLFRLLHMTEASERTRCLNGITRLLSTLAESATTVFPHELLDAVAADSAIVGRVVDGICALALYTSDYPRGHAKFYAIVNTALRVMGGSEETHIDFDDAAFLTYQVQPFIDAVTWMLRDVLPRCRDVTFRGIGYELERPRIGATFPQSCFTSTSAHHDEAGRFARRTMMVLMTQSGAAITFASFFQEAEILLPPGVELEVVARASATLLNVLHYDAGKSLVTLREVGMRPTPNELFKAVRAVLPIYDDFIRIYQVPSVAPRGQKRASQRIRAGGGAVAAILADGDHTNDASAESVEDGAETKKRVLHLDVVLDDTQTGDMLIIAPGGTGKTAAAVFAQVHLSRQDASRRLLPVFLPLSRLTEESILAPGGLDAALATALGCDVETLLQTALEFNVVAVLDSLDETTVKDAHWTGLLERNPATLHCRVIMTSRPTPLATQYHEEIFGRDRLLQLVDLLPLPQQNVSSIFAHLVEQAGAEDDEQAASPRLPAVLASVSPLIISFAAKLANDAVDISNISGERELIDLYLQHACDLPPEALSRLCLALLTRGFHCPLGEAKRVAGEDDVASRVPCRVEDEFDDASDFSLLHRSLVEHVVINHIRSHGCSAFSEISSLPSRLTEAITAALLTDPGSGASARTLQAMVAKNEVYTKRLPSAELIALLRTELRDLEAAGADDDAIASTCMRLGTAVADAGLFSRRDVVESRDLFDRARRIYRGRISNAQWAAARSGTGPPVAISANYYIATQGWANTMMQLGHAREVLPELDEAIDAMRRNPHTFTEFSSSLGTLAMAIMAVSAGDQYGNGSNRAGLQRARALFAESVQMSEAAGNLSALAILMDNYGQCLRRLADPRGAINCYERAIKIKTQLWSENHPQLIFSYSNLAIALCYVPELRANVPELNRQRRNAILKGLRIAQHCNRRDLQHRLEGELRIIDEDIASRAAGRK